jgi:hypothetical protein
VIAGFHQGFPPGQAGNFWLGLYLILVGAGLAHASALVIGLILLRKSVPHRRFSITFAQACGFVVYLMVSGSMVTRGSPDEAAADGVGYFFSYEFEWPVIRAVLGTALLAWSIIAVLRLMRSELQYRAWPWLWALFLVFCTILAAGMSPWPGSGLVGTVLAVLAALVALTYLSALADRRDPIRYRSGMAALRRCDFGRAFAELPCWLVSFSAAAIAASFAFMVLPLTGQDSWPGSISELLLHLSFLSPAHIASAVLLVLLFATRDIMVLLWLSFGSWRQRADMAWLVYLALVYWPAGIILTFAGHPGYLPAVLPVAGDDAILNFAPILVQLAASFLMLLHSWRKATTNRGAA